MVRLKLIHGPAKAGHYVLTYNYRDACCPAVALTAF